MGRSEVAAMWALYNLRTAWYRAHMRRLRPSWSSSLLIALVASCHSGASSKGDTTPTAEAPENAGVQSIHASDMKRHVELLASDEFEGRETLHPGYEKAANYMAKEFAKYGLTAMPGQDSVIVPYQLWQSGFVPEETNLALTTASGPIQAALGSGATVFSFSDDGSLDAEIVFAGYGITAKEAKYDDYDGLDVNGKWVLVLRHAPGYRDAASPFFGGDRKKDWKGPDLRTYSAFMTKALNAQTHGAKGMLLVSGPVTAEMPDDMRMPERLSVPLTDAETLERDALIKTRLELRKAATKKRAAEQAAQGQSKRKRKRKTVRIMGGPHGQPVVAKKPQGGETLLAFHISTDLGATLVAETGKTLLELQTEIDKGTLAKDIVLTSRAMASVKARKKPITVTGKNVIAYLEGSDPLLKGEYVVVGGHFDHLGGFGASNADGKDTIFNGADDNASGTAGVLELAEAFASAAVRPKRSMLFMGFSAEEKGLLGSRALVKQGPIDTKNVAFMLNLDMIGRNSGDPIEFVGGDHATDLRTIAEEANRKLGLAMHFGTSDEAIKHGHIIAARHTKNSSKTSTPSKDNRSVVFGPYSRSSDHHSFFLKEVPVAFFFTGLHEDYHGLADHPEKLDYERMEDIVKLGYGLAEGVANAEKRPTFIHKLDWLGVALQVGTVSEVEIDSRGQAAGLVVGDVLTRIGKVTVASGIAQEEKARSAGRVLGDVDPGTSVELAILRDDKAMELTLQRAKRGYLGIRPGRLTDEDRQKYSIDKSEGVLIGQAIKDAPAHKSGLRDGDIITKLAGESVNGATLMKRLSRIGAGESITVQVVRDGKRIEMPLTLGEPPVR